MDKLMMFVTLFVAVAQSYSQTIKISESLGWFESAFVKWDPVAEAESYSVYYSGNGVVDKKIENQLVRNYGAYLRADVLGLTPGTYTLKVAPIVSGVEGPATLSSPLIVKPHDRTGFAFSGGVVPGAYKADGSPKSGAVILYITEKTKNTISLDVTGASSNPCVGLQTILDGFKKGKDNRPLIIRLVGEITDLDYLNNGDIVIENNNNSAGYITLEGVGSDAVANGWGIRLKNASNIEIRNLGVINVDSGEGDDVGLQQGNDHVWVHHTDFYYGNPGGDADQAKGDGALDCKKSTYVTFSYNHFYDTGKSNLLGLSENTTTGLYITYHHNWYDHSDSRHPRVRFYSAHVYNNFYDGNAKYGVGSTLSSSVFVEGNYFRNCKYPMLTSMQGSDVWDGSVNDYGNMPTFSNEDGGTIKAFNNYMTGEKRFVAYGDANFKNSTIDFDAYVVSNQEDKVPSSVVSAYGANSYNNFDTNPAVMYSYHAETPQEAKNTVMLYAGRMQGGDLKWSFNNSVDDVSYVVNTALKEKLVNYKTKMISILGDSALVIVDTTIVVPPDTTVIPPDSVVIPLDTLTGDLVHNFTTDDLTSEGFDIVGNLSTSKGVVNYNSLILSQCLKMETATKITFSTVKSSEITLVFNADFNGRVKVNGISFSATSGIVKIPLNPGTHVITKGDASNLYYMSVLFANDDVTKNLKGVNNSKLFFTNEQQLKTIEVFNLQGSKIATLKKRSNYFDFSALRQGSYVLRIKIGEKHLEQFITIK